MFRPFSKNNDPEKILNQFLRDVQKQVPQLRVAVTQALAHRRLTEKEWKDTHEELTRIEREIPEAVKGGEATKPIALALISRKKQLGLELPAKKRELERATEQAEKAQALFNDFMRGMDVKLIEICGFLPLSLHAKAQADYEKLKQRG
jgi:phage shock protein A